MVECFHLSLQVAGEPFLTIVKVAKPDAVILTLTTIRFI